MHNIYIPKYSVLLLIMISIFLSTITEKYLLSWILFLFSAWKNERHNYDTNYIKGWFFHSWFVELIHCTNITQLVFTFGKYKSADPKALTYFR